MRDALRKADFWMASLRWSCLFLVCMTLTTSAAWAANGDTTDLAAHCGTRAIDMCVDTTTDDVFVIDQLSGEICIVRDNGDEESMTHPFGAAAFPTFTPVISGIAYDEDGDSLWVLNRTDSTLREVNKDTGVGIGLTITISPPDPDRNLIGLTYDTINDTLWARDVSGNKVLEIALGDLASTTEVEVAGDVVQTVELPLQDELVFGDGLSFLDDAGTGYLDITWGTVLECAVTRIIRVDLTGAATGHEVPLDEIADGVTGIARRASDDMLASSQTDIYSVETTYNSLLAPTFLSARSGVDGAVTLEWTNHGSGLDGAYDDIVLLRSSNGGISYDTLATLDGGDTTYTDTAVADLASLQNRNIFYRVRVGLNIVDPFTQIVVRTGTGALMEIVQFAGNNCYDLDYNEFEGELYITSKDGSGLLHRYDTDLASLGTIDLSPLDFLTGVAYNPALDTIVVATEGSTLINRFDTLGVGDGAFTTPTSGIEIGSLTYDDDLDEYMYVNLDDDEVIRVDAEDGSEGNSISECEPPIVSGLTFARGLAYLPGGTFIATVEPGALFQFTRDNCFPISGESLPFDALGPCAEDDTAVNGVVVVGNVAFLALANTNSIAKILLAPVREFTRGDSNGDELTELADVIHMADFIFSDGEDPDCLDAVDTNDDGRISISDPLYLIYYLYLDGPEPPEPFAVPGFDPTFLDGIGC